MSDILRVTTPLVNKNQPVQPKTGVEPAASFNIQDTARVIQTHNQSEILKQNTGNLEGKEAPELLLSLLKDPAVAASYLKNIFLLEEFFKLLPANNQTVTQEIKQLFHTLLLQPEDIASEMMRQEQASTLFKGEFFDFLRQIGDSGRGKPEMQLAIAGLLKSVNNFLNGGDVLDAVANSLSYLKENLAPSRELSARLESLIRRFRQPLAGEDFQQLKSETLALLKDIEGSILFSPKLGKVLSITIYNLSRYNESWEYFHEAAYRLRQMLAGPELQQYLNLLQELTQKLQTGWGDQALREALPEGEEGLAGAYSNSGENPEAAAGAAATADPRGPGADSRVMEALIRIIEKQSGDQAQKASDAGSVEKILHSLLSSPCNFTPLLHFILPALYENTRAFAEVWINPDSDSKDMPAGVERGIHFLLVIDVENLGRFEAEIFAHEKTVDFFLYCPQGFEEPYREMMRGLPKLFADSPYRLGETRLETLEKSRSLMDVFKSLPYKRVGVDVKI
ncbi:MAG: antitoxin [Peptococcaceae bacterium]|nr:antitoxin [Peptococcaceae bacterium]